MPDQCYSFRFPDVTEPCTGTQINDFCDMAAFSEGLCVNRFRTAFVGETPYFGCSTTSGRQPTLGNWPNGSGMWEVSTPYGPGFQFISHDETEVESDGKKVQLHGHNGPEIGTMGATYEFRGTAMFPPAYRPHASGRPQGERSSYGEGVPQADATSNAKAAVAAFTSTARIAAICECFGGIRRLQLNPTVKVTVSVAGLPLGQVATMFDRILERDVLLPAARAQKKVRLKMENVRLSEVLRALGLSTQRPASTPRKGAATGRTQ